MTPKMPVMSETARATAAYNAGNALCRAGRMQDGVVEYRKALALRPDYVDAQINLANALQHLGNNAEAIAVLKEALQRRPEYAQAWSNLAWLYREGDNFELGIEAANKAIALAPKAPQPLVNLSICLTEARRYTEAADAARRAIALRGDFAEAHASLGGALRYLNQYDEAIAALRRAVSLRPNYAIGLNNLAIALADTDQFEEAIAVHRQAVAAVGGEAGMRWNLSFTLLKAGHFREGFVQYEARHQVLAAQSSARSSGKPQWDGSDLSSRTILLHAEQGVGDTIQFIRYLPMVVGRGGRVILECQSGLHRLLGGLPGVAGLVPAQGPMPAFDVYCAVMTLPAVFETTLKTIPAQIPYLHSEKGLLEDWARRVEESAGKRLKVGLCWAGDPRLKNDRNRSMPAGEFAPLGKLKGVWFCNLQKRGGGSTGEPARPSRTELPADLAVTDWTEELRDFADTAALIENLDVVISVDTAVAHLGGALGKPVFLLLPKPSEWRWMSAREDSPWYPTMRLFRQSRPCQWGEPMARVAEAIAGFVQDRGA
jgi:tetratricopeptide (TPR) repeat protein